jgi:hypothetical protein
MHVKLAAAVDFDGNNYSFGCSKPEKVKGDKTYVVGGIDPSVRHFVVRPLHEFTPFFLLHLFLGLSRPPHFFPPTRLLQVHTNTEQPSHPSNNVP